MILNLLGCGCVFLAIEALVFGCWFSAIAMRRAIKQLCLSGEGSDPLQKQARKADQGPMGWLRIYLPYSMIDLFLTCIDPSASRT